jgi:hypothetical protein
MIWGFIKLCVFVSLAIFTGVLCATVPVGGKTIAARAQTLWAQPEVKREVGQLQNRVRRGVAAATADQAGEPGTAPAPTPAAPAPRATQVDPHAVAKVVSDAPPGDDFRASEREAVQHLIRERARKAAHRAH